MTKSQWIIATVIVAVMPGTGARATAAGDRDPVTSIADVRAMSDDEVCAQVQVVLRGIATWINRSADDTLRHLIVQEGDAGVWVTLRTAREDGTWRGDDESLANVASGSILEIEGTTEGGGFSPMVAASTVREVGTAPLPPAREVDMDRFFAGGEDCLRVEVTGVVQWIGGSGNRDLTIDHGGRQFVATIPRALAADATTTLVDGRVRFRGVAGSVFSTRGELLYPRLIVDDPADVIVEEPPRSEPFEAPQVPLRAIAHFRPQPLDGHRLRTEGVVTFSDGDRLIYVQDGLTGVRVESVAAANVRPGERIEIAGFLDRRRRAAGLVGCLVRVISSGAAPPPVPIAPADVLASIRTLHERGIMARPGDYDGCLVEFPGRLIDIDRTESGGRFTVAVDRLDSPVTVVLDADAFRALRSIEAGSDLLLRGILQLEHSVMQRTNLRPSVDSVSLLVRSPADIAVVRGPPWWNARRLATAAALLAAVLLGAGAWVFLLRRQVARQAAKIAAEMQQRRDAAVEFEAALRERSRLAANLHDTLLQALAGAVLQIDLSRKSLTSRQIDKAGDQIDVAKRMVKHSVADLRNSVWSLRTAPQAGRTFRESLLTMLDQFQGDGGGEVTLDVSGEPFELPNFVAGNLLLVVQEAVRNAIHHGRAKTVRVAVEHGVATRSVAIEITDDGTGFDPTTIMGPEQGHFGLQVMRERIEGLSGSFAIETRSGEGTKMRATVPLTMHQAATR
jgi:signal transduction histidine kinase